MSETADAPTDSQERPAELPSSVSCVRCLTSLGGVLAMGEGDVGTEGKGAGAHGSGGFSSAAVGVDANVAEVGAQAGLEERTRRLRQRLAAASH